MDENKINHVIVNVEIAIVRRDRYVMIVRGEGEDFGAGWLTFPGGKIDWNDQEPDSIEQTARREAYEEVGIRLGNAIHYVESHTFGTGDDPCLDIVVLAEPADPLAEPVIAAPDEVAAIVWMTAAEAFADPRVQPWTHESLRRTERKRHELGW